MVKGHSVCVYVGEALGRYGFGDEHPFGPERMGVFWDRMISQGLDAVVGVHDPVHAERADIERFYARLEAADPERFTTKH